jgi:hypothetical protein
LTGNFNEHRYMTDEKLKYNLFQNQKSTNTILPRKYNRQRRQLLFLVCLQV